jgi:hypothetical protein
MPRITVEGGGRAPMRDHGDGGFRGGDRGGGRNNNNNRNNKIMCEVEGPEKTTRGGVNGCQSKFSLRTWPMSQNQPETPLF